MSNDSANPPLARIDVEILHETANAYLVEDAGNEVWIPKSQVKEIEFYKDGSASMTIPEWLAVREGLI